MEAGEKVVDHFDVDVALDRILCSVRADLDAGRIKRSVLVLERRDEDYLFEPVQALLAREVIQHCFLKVLGVSHLELSKGVALLPLLEDPHAR